jgi:thimet oligopeptidase
MTTASLPKAATLLAGTADGFASSCDTALATAKANVAKLKALPKDDAATKLALYDEATTLMSNAGARSGLAREVHPDEKFRAAAEACEQRIEGLSVALAQDKALYEALSAIDGKAFDPVTGFWLFKTLREFRRAGVDRDDATRERVKTLNEELVKLGQSFGRNIRDDVRTVKAKPADLVGLPKDFLDAHPAGADGLVSITTNPPDYLPVMTYAKNASVREALWRAYRNRAFPPNVVRHTYPLASSSDPPDTFTSVNARPGSSVASSPKPSWRLSCWCLREYGSRVGPTRKAGRRRGAS